MNFATYAQLKQSIADELNRDDLTDSIAGFISLAEVSFQRDLRTREMVALTVLSVNGEYVPIPVDFLEARKLSLNTVPVTDLEFITEDVIIIKDVTNIAPRKPRFVSVVGDQFQFSPVPDTTYSARFSYYKTIPKLSDLLPTNWVLEKHPDLYFYGALTHSAPYLKEDARIAVWAGLYNATLDAIKKADQRAQTAAHGLQAFARSF